MPKYTYNGITFSSKEALTPDELDEIISQFEDTPKEEDGYLMSAGKGLASGLVRGGNAVATGAAQATLGAMELLSKLDSSASGSSPAISDESKQAVTEWIENQDKFWEEHDPLKGNDSITGKVAAGVGMLPQFMNPLTAPLAIAGMGAETGRRHIRDGGTVAGAQTAQALDTGLAAAGVALPAAMVPGKMANSAATAGAFAGQSWLARKGQQGIRALEANDMPQLPDMTGGDLAAQAIIGGGMGYMLGKSKAETTAAQRIKKLQEEPKVDQDEDKTPTTKESIIERFNKFKETAILEKERILAQNEKTLSDMEADPDVAQNIITEKRNEVQALRKEIYGLRGGAKEEAKPINEVFGNASTSKEYVRINGKTGIVEFRYKDEQGNWLGDWGRKQDIPATKEEPPTTVEEKPVAKEKTKVEEQIVPKEDVVQDNPPEELLAFIRPIRDDIINNPDLQHEGFNYGDGRKTINLERIKNYFKNLSQKSRDAWGIHSERAMQIFVELHEKAHDFVHPSEGESIGSGSSHENRVNMAVWEFWKTIKDKRHVSAEAIRKFGEGRVTELPDSAFKGERYDSDYNDLMADQFEKSVKDLDNDTGTLETPRDLPPKTPEHDFNEKETRNSFEAFKKKEQVDKMNRSPEQTVNTIPALKYKLRKAESWLDWINKSLGISTRRIGNDTNPDATVYPNQKYTPDQLTEMKVKAERQVELFQKALDRLEGKVDPKELKKQMKQNYQKHDSADDFWDSYRSEHETLFRNRDEYVEQMQKNGMSQDAAQAEADKWFPKDDPDLEGHAFNLDGDSPKKALKATADIISGKTKTPFGIKITSAKEAIKQTLQKPDIPGISSKFFANIFGRMGFARIYQDVPAINFIHNTIQDAKVASEKFINDTWNGEMHKVRKDWEGKVIKPLKALVAMDSPSAVLERISDKSLVKLMNDVFPDGYRNGRNYHETLALWRDRLTPDEVQAFSVLSNMFRKLSLGISKQRKGWYPAVRKGDYMVKIYSNGNVWYAEMFRSSVEAEHFISRVKDQLPKGDSISSVLDLKAAKENQSMDFQFALDIADDIANKIAPDKAEAIKKMVDAKLGKQDPYSKHNRQRFNIAGYEGNKLFGNEASIAHEWKKALHHAVEEKGSALSRGIINSRTAELFDSPNDVKHYNSVEAARILRDMAIGKIKSKIDGTDVAIYNAFDRVAIAMARKMGAKEWFPQIPVWDRITGVSTRLFYIRTLTSRPAFWLAQALTSPLAIRDMLRTSSIADSLLYSGKGTMNILYGGSKEFREGLFWTAQNTETFHPNFINDLNNLVKSDSRRFHSDVFEIFTGEKFATAADSFSRYWTYAMMFERFKGEGFHGTELYKRAAEATDSTMILYSAKEKAPIIRRAGTVGQLASPLLTFSQGALANFVADFRFMVKTGNASPLAATFLIQTLLGGLIGAPMVAEWELLRQAIIKMAPDMEEYLPSVVEFAMMGSTPDWVSHGVPSATTGFDIGSGTRWNPILNGLLTGQKNFLEMAPAINWAVDTIGSAATTAKALTFDNVPMGQRRDAAMKIAPVAYMTPLVDRTTFSAGDREYVPDSKHGLPIVEQTIKEEVAQGMGTKTMERAKAEKANFIGQKNEELRRERVAKLYDLLSDRLSSGKDTNEIIQKLVDNDVSPQEILSHIKSRNILNNRSVIERFKYGSSKNPSKTPHAYERRNMMEGFKGD